LSQGERILENKRRSLKAEVVFQKIPVILLVIPLKEHGGHPAPTTIVSVKSTSVNTTVCTYYWAVGLCSSSGEAFNRFLNTATSAMMPVCKAGSTSGAKRGE
jgi:hypothetical protein